MPNERRVRLERDLLPEQIRHLREEKTWLQSELAEQMNRLGFHWTQATVAGVETKRRLVSIGEAIGLATVFGVRLAELFRDKELWRMTAGQFEIALDAEAHVRYADAIALLEGGTPARASSRGSAKAAPARVVKSSLGGLTKKRGRAPRKEKSR